LSVHERYPALWNGGDRDIGIARKLSALSRTLLAIDVVL
jgi:hypothetical protein